MKLLLKLAFRNRKHYVLMLITLMGMLGLTFATQMEMFALGVISNTGSDFFTLFAPENKGKIERVESISLTDVQERWKEVDDGKSGAITRKDATRYMATRNDGNPLATAMRWIDSKVNLSGNFILLAAVLTFVAVFKGISLFTSKYMTQVVAIRVSRDLRQSYFEHIQSLPMSFYNHHNIGSLSTRAVGDASVIAMAINSALQSYLHTPFVVVSTLSVCFYLSWKLSLIIFVGLPLLVFPIVMLARRVKRIAKQMQRNQENFASTLIDFLGGIQTVKLFAMEDFSLKKYQEQNNRNSKLEEKSSRYDSSTRPILHTIATLFLCGVLLYGMYVAKMELSEIIVFCGLLWMFYEPIKSFADQNAQVQRGVVAAERMFEVLNLKPQIQDHEGSIELKSFEGEVEFDNVWFRYEKDWVLQGLSFSVKKGQTVAIVGPTGAGKSTIVQLIPRLYEIEKGEIRVDGRPLTGYTQRSLRENIAFVPQRPFLFMDTVSENIGFGRKFSPEAIQEAARKAYADEFIQHLPEKYETVLAETGKSLSGGQQQRLAVARALVKRAPILIMDEATSSLDTVSENRIKLAIQELHGQVTQILIAHRLSTIAHADKIIYVERGRKVAEGTKDELLVSCSGFRLMWELMYMQEESEAALV